jgi:hypothetical protein
MQTSKEEEGVAWRDILEHYAGFAAEKEKSYFSKETGVIPRNVVLKGENIPRDSTDRALKNSLTTESS